MPCNFSRKPNSEELEHWATIRAEEKRKTEEKSREARARLEVIEKRQEEKRAQEEKRKQERDRQIQNIVESLKGEAVSSHDYLVISSSLRNEAEEARNIIIKKHIDDWSSNEAELFKTLNNFPNRLDCFASVEENLNDKILEELRAIVKVTQENTNESSQKLVVSGIEKLNYLMGSLLKGQSKQIGLSQKNRESAKLAIAGHVLSGGIAAQVEEGVENAFDLEE